MIVDGLSDVTYRVIPDAGHLMNVDNPAAVTAALRAAGVDGTRIEIVDVCTSCNAGTHWSHRPRGDVERQGVVVWRSASTS
jgi:copper oxidase (laccase) domain-containing protein